MPVTNSEFSKRLHRSAFSLSPQTPKPHFPLSLHPVGSFSGTVHRYSFTSDSSSMATTSAMIEQQFDDFRLRLDKFVSLRDRIRAVASEIESCTRIMRSSLLLVHQSRPIPEILEKCKAQIDVVRELFGRIAAAITRECQSPGQYHRYINNWRTETQTVVSLLAFMQWLETGSLLMRAEAEEKLGLKATEFGLDIEDYLVGICYMSNELPRYVVNQVTAGDFDCPRKVLKLLTDLHAAFHKLNLRNDFLRKKIDGMKNDLKRVEQVHYDVKIRGLGSKPDSTVDQLLQEEELSLHFSSPFL